MNKAAVTKMEKLINARYFDAVEIKVMLVLAVIVGVFVCALGVWYCLQIKRTPKDKLVPFGVLGGAWMTRDAAYAVAISLFILAAICFLLGSI